MALRVVVSFDRRSSHLRYTALTLGLRWNFKERFLRAARMHFHKGVFVEVTAWIDGSRASKLAVHRNVSRKADFPTTHSAATVETLTTNPRKNPHHTIRESRVKKSGIPCGGISSLENN